MMGKVIAVANMKGGVGKTATIVGLAETLGASGHAVLVIDLDPQASASICLAGDEQLSQLIEAGRTIDAYLSDRILGGERLDFGHCVHGAVSNVMHQNKQLPIALLASSPYLRLLERELVFNFTGQGYGPNAAVGRLFRLMRTQMRRAAQRYDFILVDCAPGISALTEAFVRLANLVIVPTIPDFLSSYGLQAFCQSLWSGELANLTNMARPALPPHVLITRRNNTREHRLISDALRSRAMARRLSYGLYDVEIPEAAAIARALGKTEGHPLFTAADAPTFINKWSTEVVTIWERLAGETKEVLDVA